VKLLVVSPDFASHYRPLAAIAAAASWQGADVAVATGTGMAPRVYAGGFRWCELRMSEGSNPGVLARQNAAADPMDMAGFFAATRAGMVATLSYQAGMRSQDLLWEPVDVACALLRIVEREQPDAIVVDHLAFACTLGLRAGGHPFTTFVPGHPSQIPAGDELYGYPVAWPSWVDPSLAALDDLRQRCAYASKAMTATYNDVLGVLAPSAVPVEDAFAAHGDDVLFNSAPALRNRERVVPASHAWLGACVRGETLDGNALAWLEGLGDEPFVYVSLGTFLSARADVLRRIVEALIGLGVHAALSTGSTDPAALGTLPPHWLVAPALPQVALLDHAAAVVTHGGNNTVTEALRACCPMVVLPFSTDQFATAADLERTGLAASLDPNRARQTDLAPAIADALAGAHPALTTLSAELRADPGATIAADRVLWRIRGHI